MQICMKKSLSVSLLCSVYLPTKLNANFLFLFTIFFPSDSQFIHMKPRVYEYSSMSECNNLESESEKKLFKIKSSINFIASIMKSWVGHIFN